MGIEARRAGSTVARGGAPYFSSGAGCIALSLYLLCLPLAASHAEAQTPSSADPGAPAEPAEPSPPPSEQPSPAPPAPLGPPSQPGAASAAGTEVSAEGSVEASLGANEASAESSAELEAPPPAAQAPEESNAELPEAIDESSPEIVITGTRIKRKTSFSPSAPVEVLDRKQLSYRGESNLADMVQYLTVAQGSSYSGAAASPGTASVNLRGLGAGATLLLLNGRRMHYSAGGIAEHFGDLSTIPMAAVERIEILKGGASAIYGSDAVGGVVNVITRKNWDGARFELTGQTLDGMEQANALGSAAFGSNSDKSRVMAAAAYSRSGELLANERDFTEGRYQSTLGHPAAYIVGASAMPDPACTPGNVEGSEPLDDGLCSFDYRDFSSLQSRGERVNAIMTAEHDLTNHTTVFGEVVVSRLRGNSLTQPSFPVPPPFPVVPAEHVDNPFGQDVLMVGRPFGRAEGGKRNGADDDTFRGVLGLKGDFEDAADETLFESWEWELYASFGISRYRFTIHDNVRQALQDALNACSDPADLSNCFNPFYSAIDGTGTPNSEAVKRRIQGTMNSLNDHALQTYNAGMTGSLFELPGGDVGLAFGGELRHEFRSSELDQVANNEGYGFVLGNTDALAERDVYSGYLELRWPFYDGVELQTAGRAERYTDIDVTALSPSVGITLIPSEIGGRNQTPSALHKLVVRGHATQAFRAPTIYQSFPGFATVPTSITLPGDTLPTFMPVQYFGNPELEEEEALALGGGLAWQPFDPLSLSVDYWYYDYQNRIYQETPQSILASHFDSLDSGGGGDPRVLRDPLTGEIARIQSLQVNSEGSVITHGLDFGLLVSIDGADFGGSENDFGTFGVGATGTYTFSYEIPEARAAGRQLPDGSVLPPIDCDGGSCEVAGKRNETNFAPPVPKLKASFPLTWSYEGHSLAFIPRFVSGVQDDAGPAQDGSFSDIDPWTTLDASYGFTLKEWLGKELTLRVGVLNLLDSAPPHANIGSTSILSAAYESLMHDPRGRMLWASIASEL